MPYLAAWVQLYDIDTHPVEGSSSLFFFAVYSKSGATLLYLAALWIPRPWRTPSCQVSTACRKRLSAWFRHWQGKMMPRNGQFDLSILFVCSGFSLRAPRSKLCYRNTESVFLNSTRVVARQQQQVQAPARTRNNIVLPTQSISNSFNQKSVCFFVARAVSTVSVLSAASAG